MTVSLSFYYFSILDKPTEFDLQDYYADEAYQQFQKVYASSTNISMKQKSLWMMAKCFQKKYPSRLEYSYFNANPGTDYELWLTNANIHFNEFQNQYTGTPFYDEVYSECSYFRNFVAKK